MSALHEWCDKRRMSPSLTLLEGSSQGGFGFSVELNGQEWSRGRGGTKASAKQDAARRALQALLPGVVFDDNGLVVEIPTTPNPPDSFLEDLAPNLAKRLAIGQKQPKDDDNDEDNGNKDVDDYNKKRRKKPPPSYYSTTTTTSEDDDENAYYASRGASVCSALLHAMWQIDETIPEPPSYKFQICANPANNAALKRKASMTTHRSSFACTATLRVNRPAKDDDDDKEQDRLENDKEDASSSSSSSSSSPAGAVVVQTLSAVGTGATKRDARHVASAKLLAMLFPGCDGMVEVKAAAEARRQEYAALKQQSKRAARVDNAKKRLLPSPRDPLLPPSLLTLLRDTMTDNDDDDDEDAVSVEGLSLSENKPSIDAVAAVTAAAMLKTAAMPASLDHNTTALASTQKATTTTTTTPKQVSLARQKQLDELVDAALQLQNEVDEEGRSLPTALNRDDVGRTVLRRAMPEDRRWIEKLLRDSSANSDPKRKKHSSSSNNNNNNNNNSNTLWGQKQREYWGSTTITLLLCRAIVPYDEPPLGCAILTLSFHWTKGRTLRIAAMGNGPHLPQERFLECLEVFGKHLKCELEEKTDNPRTVLHTNELRGILKAYASSPPPVGSSRATALQSVQEEEAEVDLETEGSPTKVASSKNRDKPNKRSRMS